MVTYPWPILNLFLNDMCYGRGRDKDIVVYILNIVGVVLELAPHCQARGLHHLTCRLCLDTSG